MYDVDTVWCLVSRVNRYVKTFYNRDDLLILQSPLHLSRVVKQNVFNQHYTMLKVAKMNVCNITMCQCRFRREKHLLLSLVLEQKCCLIWTFINWLGIYKQEKINWINCEEDFERVCNFSSCIHASSTTQLHMDVCFEHRLTSIIACLVKLVKNTCFLIWISPIQLRVRIIRTPWVSFSSCMWLLIV